MAFPVFVHLECLRQTTHYDHSENRDYYNFNMGCLLTTLNRMSHCYEEGSLLKEGLSMQRLSDRATFSPNELDRERLFPMKMRGAVHFQREYDGGRKVQQ